MKINNHIEKYRQGLRERLIELKSSKGKIKKEIDELNKEIKLKSEELSLEQVMKMRQSICGESYMKLKQVEEDIAKIEKDLLEKKFANNIMYTDVVPFEVIEERTPNLYVIRSMKSEQTEQSKKDLKESFIPGGFCGHFDNDLQEWDITPDDDGLVIKIRRHKDGIFYDVHGGRYSISSKPIKFYDFNF